MSNTAAAAAALIFVLLFSSEQLFLTAQESECLIEFERCGSAIPRASDPRVDAGAVECVKARQPPHKVSVEVGGETDAAGGVAAGLLLVAVLRQHSFAKEKNLAGSRAPSRAQIH